MGRGRPIDRSQWPGDRPHLAFFELIDGVHGDNGLKSLSDIAKAMNLVAKSRVSTLLRGTLPADESQAQELIRALGGSAEDVERGVRLYRSARSSPAHLAVPGVRRRDDPAGKGLPGMPPLAVGPSAFQPAYLWQVRRVAPPELIGREAELAELALFCTESDARPYMWWQASAWSGKSALLSTFVLHAPDEVAERVRFVSFFITARLADTREAFIQLMLDQLAGLLGQTLPAALPEASREVLLLDLMSQAAVACREAGMRLVLVVDGLDEERGVTTGPDARSIAGLLPAHPPPAGMRVIVAGRPNPPVPDDVPGWHPLRDPQIIRPMTPSAHARGMRDLSTRELKRLLRGTRDERDLLGLLTAARGGLTANDLAELLPLDRWDVEEILNTATGRTFARRASILAPGTLPDVYLLGHEELQSAAEEYLRAGGHLAGYRDRLHGWAADWRTLGWPQRTPEYLLGGYYRILEEIRDLPHMIEYATDVARHDRMLAETGADAAAFSEIRAALDRIAAQDSPDIAAALTLACHRDHLLDRNANIPPVLPAVWDALGQPIRAQALAAAIATTQRPESERAGAARALATAGVRQQAEAIAQSIHDPYEQAEALEDVARALAENGYGLEALATASSMPDPFLQMNALAEVARALVAAGQREQAETAARLAQDAAKLIDLGSDEPVAVFESAQACVARTLAVAGQGHDALTTARSITDCRLRANVLADAALALAAAGQREEAETAARLAHATTHSITHGDELGTIARALAATGQHEQALAVAHSVPDPGPREQVLGNVAQALAAAGEGQQALTVARSLGFPGMRASALTKVARALSVAGQHQQAATAGRLAQVTAQSINPQVTSTLAEVAQVLAEAGCGQEALATARSISDLTPQARALANLARTLFAAGQPEHAEMAARLAQEAGQSIVDDRLRAGVLAVIARTLVAAGQPEQAETAARLAQVTAQSINPIQGMSTLAEVAQVLAEAGCGQEALATAHLISGPALLTNTLAHVAQALVAAGRRELGETAARLAEEAARSISDPDRWTWTLTSIARGLTAAREFQRAETVARSISDPPEQAGALGDVAQALAGAGQDEKAMTIAQSIPIPFLRAVALARVAQALVAAGRREQAETAAQEAETAARSISDSYKLPRVCESVARALVATGHYEQAETTPRSIPDPEQRATVMAGIAQELAAAGQLQQAQTAAKQAATSALSTPDPARRARALASVVRALAVAGRRELAETAAQEAETAARSISDSYDRMRAFTSLARALVATGHFEQAETTARSIADPEQRATVMAGIAQELAAAGQLQQAQTTAKQAAETLGQSIFAPREWSLASVVRALTATGQYRQAESIARSIDHPLTQAEALSNIARSLAVEGDYQQAIIIARSVAEPDLQAGVLADVAEVLISAGAIKTASQLVAAACAAGQCETAATAAAQLAPSACTFVLRTLQEHQ